jgi:hypothetical protein
MALCLLGLSFLVSWGGVKLSPPGTSATNWPIVPAPGDIGDDECGPVGGIGIGKGKNYSEKTCPSATLSTTNPTWLDLGSNPGRRAENPVANRLNYGTAICAYLRRWINLPYHNSVFFGFINTLRNIIKLCPVLNNIE